MQSYCFAVLRRQAKGGYMPARNLVFGLVKLVFFISSILFIPKYGLAVEPCGFNDPRINFSDGTRGCIRADLPLFNIRNIIPNDSRTYRTIAQSHRIYTVAVTRDQNICPFVSGVAWDWPFAENRIRALDFCKSKFPKEYSSCNCQVIIDHWDSPFSRNDFVAKLALIDKQLAQGGGPLSAVASLPSGGPIGSKASEVTVTPPRAQIAIPGPYSVQVPPLQVSVTALQPTSLGEVTLVVQSNKDLISLQIDGLDEGPRKSGRIEIRRFAPIGTTVFEVAARDSRGVTHIQSVTVSREFTESVLQVQRLNPLRIRPVPQTDAIAVVIGIEKYRRVTDAAYANRDASTFVDYAMRALGVRAENVRLILDEKADAAEILRAFKTWLPTRVNKGQTDVYVFFSGHGLPSADGRSLYFLPHEVDKDLLERTALTQAEVVEAIQRTDPKSVMMFIDSCYSGQSRTGETLLTSARPILITAKSTEGFPENFTVISASAPDQISSSSPDLQHGIFSYYLMRGMEGEADSNKDGQITVAEIQSYLSEQVPRRAMGMNRTQQPQVVGDQTRVLVSSY